MSEKKFKIGFMGAGKMARALIGAILRGQVSKGSEIICSDYQDSQLQAIKKEFGVQVTLSNKEVIEQSEIVVLAFKPQNFPEAVLGLGEVVTADTIILSIMAGVQIKDIAETLPGKVVRVMPNTACLVGQMAGGFAVGDHVTESDIARVRPFLDCAGLALPVTEKQLDAVTGVSGSGIAFVARLIETFVNAGVKEGLDQETARKLVLKTFSGTANLLDEWNMSPEELIAMVSSPNGTTIAGREILESSDLGEVIAQTVARVIQRSEELAVGK
ncbi:MAG: pyrroline-5-carboxylate reductase [Phycisphaerae bacterium]|nr:pyrroline-5-carboxylate reductase [Phycisphaerae bacterium]